MDNNLKKQQEEVILSWDKNNPKKLEIAHGVDEQGNLQKTTVDQGKDIPFLDLNGNSNLFDAFIHNFKQQLVHPKDFIFLRMPEKVLKESWHQVKNNLSLLIDSNILLRLDPRTYLNKSNSDRIDIDRIDWNKAAQWGITREGLEESQKNGDKSLELLLTGKKTKLLEVTANLGGTLVPTQARLQLKMTPEGDYFIDPILKRQKLDLESPYYGHYFTPEDKHNIETSGFPNRILHLQLDPQNPDVLIPCFVAKDDLTNTLENMPVSSYQRGQAIYEQIPTPEQEHELLCGRSVYLDQMKTKTGQPMDADVRINPVNGAYKLDFSRSKNQQQTRKYGQGQQNYQGRNNQYGNNNYNQGRSNYNNRYSQSNSNKNSYGKKRNY